MESGQLAELRRLQRTANGKIGTLAVLFQLFFCSLEYAFKKKSLKSELIFMLILNSLFDPLIPESD